MRAMYYRTRFIVVAGLLASGLLATGCKKKAAAPPPAGPPEVSVITIEPKRVEITTELPGRTSAYLIAEVRPQVSGIIQKRVFTEEATSRPARCSIKSTRHVPGSLRQRKGGKARAEATVIRQNFGGAVQGTGEDQGVSQQDYDNAFAGLKQAEADLASAQAAVETGGINLAYTKLRAHFRRIGKSAVTTAHW